LLVGTIGGLNLVSRRHAVALDYSQFLVAHR
jgi:hypothetical protein